MRLIAALLLACSTGAAAQELILSPIPPQLRTLPKTINLTDKAGKIVGTMTYSDRRFYLRDAKGGFIATIIINADGSKTAYDYSGHEIDASKLPALPESEP